MYLPIPPGFAALDLTNDFDPLYGENSSIKSYFRFSFSRVITCIPYNISTD